MKDVNKLVSVRTTTWQWSVVLDAIDDYVRSLEHDQDNVPKLLVGGAKDVRENIVSALERSQG